MKYLITKPARIVIICISVLLVIVSIIFIFNVNTNYDMTEYLPENAQTKNGLDVLDETFGNHAIVELMINDVSILEAYQIKLSLQDIEGIQQIIWLDNQADISNPASIDEGVMMQYYQDGYALMQVVFVEDDYDLSVERTLDEIRETLDGESFHLRGSALSNIESREIAEGEMFKIILFIVPICFIILIFASHSWIEPLVVLIVLGIGVVVNLGSNIFLPNVSFITLSIAAALQLAISLDYSLFFIHRFYEYRDDGDDPMTSVNKAFKKAFPVITASALTTIIGFVALFLMRYKIGMDIGIVLTKGIVLSYLSVIIILPVLMIVFASLFEKLRHRHFMFHLGGLKSFLIKYRYISLVVLFVCLIGGIYLNRSVKYSYGSSEYSNSDSVIAQDDQAIANQFGSYDRLTILLKDSNKTKELSLIGQLNGQSSIIKIDALYTVVNPVVPEDMIPEHVVSMYRQGEYTRMTLYTSITEESEEMFAFHDRLSSNVDANYEDYYILGMAASVSEIRDTVQEDSPIVIFASITLIAMVLAIVFKSFIVPILMVLVIQSAIWLNIGLLSINQRPLIYIGYLVVFAIQLGATIDYAVLFSNRYIEARKTLSKQQSIHLALKKASIPIMISGFVLAAAGFTQLALSDILVVGDIGLLLGRGALLSMAMVLLFLPGLIYMFDRWITKPFSKRSIDNKESK